MNEWFERAFGTTVDEARYAIADARSKLIDEAWFGRRSPEPHRQPDLGWTRADNAEPHEGGNPDHVQGRDHDLGIGR